MYPLCGKPVLERVFNQLSFSAEIEKTILATSVDRSDDLLEAWAHELGYSCYRGNLENVLERFYRAARENNAEAVVRVTADCPLIDPEVVDTIINGFIGGNFDYYSNTIVPTFPDGLDTEVFKISALERAFQEAELKSEKEHVTPFIKNHQAIFSVGNFESRVNYEKFRWTLDNPEDYQFIKSVYENLYRPRDYIHWKDVLRLIEERPGLAEINRHVERNEGYKRSLEEDRAGKEI